uniref:Uncharacterized protein n=1 Tax=Vibrio cholerae O37 TaxID=185332 RepID=H9CJC0_VIBCL|nr:hypothetical protein [Vibrio cholerae O37]
MPWDWQVQWSARCRILEGFEGSTQTRRLSSRQIAQPELSFMIT